jgi:hypothetical protein
MSSVQAGRILQLTVKTWVLRQSRDVAPGDGQGEMLATYLPKEELAKRFGGRSLFLAFTMTTTRLRSGQCRFKDGLKRP